jgi:hypothetical protein
MEVRISPGARKYLANRGADSVVLRLVEMETGCSVGIAKDVDVRFEPPARPGGFLRRNAQGIDVYIDRRLGTQETVVIKKQGFWRFSCLYADGLRVPI